MNNGVVVALTATELTALLQTARKDNPKFYVLALISVVHGLRVSEAINLKREDFKGDKPMYLTVARLKGSQRTVQKLITSENALMDELSVVTEYIRGLAPGDLLFPDWRRDYVWTLMQRIGEDAGVPEHKRFPHVLKHTTGLLLRLSGAKLEEIKEQLGHKSIASTAAYLRVTGEDVEAATAKAFAGVGATPVDVAPVVIKSVRIRAGVKAFAVAGGA